MSNILHPFTSKKGQKEWSKLPEDSKSKVIEAAVLEKVRPIMTQQVTSAFINGSEYELESLYNRFVSAIDDLETNSIEWTGQVEALLSYIRLKHLTYVSKQAKQEQNEGEHNGET